MMAVRAKESSIGSARSGVKPSHNAVTSLSNYGKLIACRAWKGNKMKTTLATLLLAISLTAPAADLSIALGGDVTSMDPHFHNLTPNNNVCQHVFDTLVMKDAGGGIKPGLAESWRVVDDLTWEFKLRKGVRFHDGSNFTAADVVFSLDRIPLVPNSPSPFTTYSKQVTEKIVVDPWTVRLRSAVPYPRCRTT